MLPTDSVVQRYIRLDPDVRLMLQVREGDAEAFEELVRRYQARLLTVLQHWTGNREQAEDLAQEVFLRVFRSRGSYQPSAKFATWLFTIAGNATRNARRTLARRREVPVGDGGASSAVSLEELALAKSGQLPTRQADRAEVSLMVAGALQMLSERQRLAVLLSKFEGMSYQEIGDTMGLSPSAVKSLLSRAREKLRDSLEPYLEHGAKV